MLILAIETSCDETAAAVVRDGRDVLSNVLATSQEAFKASGGVIPEEAARRQTEAIPAVLRQALQQSGVSIDQLDALAVTRGPGLLGSLLVGTTTARTLASLWQKPLIGVHHTLGHLSSPWLEQADPLVFPSLTLSASGGHTDLWLRTSHTRGALLGRTLDDAAGEAFDKGASLLELPYPGGPSIATAAETGRPDAFAFPLPLRGKEGLNWSFSGLKTALKYQIRDLQDNWQAQRADLAAAYQEAICRHLVGRLEDALQIHPEVREVHLVGGVSANTRLRALAQNTIGDRPLRTPVHLRYCTDNAAMIGAAAEFLVQDQGMAVATSFTTAASLPLEAVIS